MRTETMVMANNQSMRNEATYIRLIIDCHGCIIGILHTLISMHSV